MANNLSPPGSSSYSSNTLTVGDGTWDFEKNTFLLPNLQGLNFETMRYNGMGNRFSTLTEYHSLIIGHGVIAAITFLFIIPIAVFIARFYSRRPGYAIRYHAYLQIITVGFSTVVFVLGFIAVGPPRNLTNPHHGIGVAIYVMILVQAFGGSLIRKITGHSFRLHLHRWMGRAIAILGIAQVPLGLTLYGSPKYCFILYALWMGFLLILYFILDYRDKERREYYAGGPRSEVTGYTDEKSESHHHGRNWLGLAAGAGALAMLRGRKRNRNEERALDRSPSPYRSHAPHDGETDITSSHVRHDSYHDDKYTDVSSRRNTGEGGGWMGKLVGLGAGLLAAKYLKKNHDRRDDEYSAVSTETGPSRLPPRRGGPAPTESDYTDYTDYTRTDNRRNSKQNPVLASEAESAADDRRPYRPGTPPRSHAGRRNSRFDSTIVSDYSSYVSPSRREEPEKKRSSGAGKGLLSGLGLGWFAKKTVDRRAGKEEDRIRDEDERRREEEDRRFEEEERRAGRRNSKFTGDGYPSPSRRDSQRRPAAMRPAAPTDMTSTTGTSVLSDEFTTMEPRGHAPYDPAPVSGGARPPPAPIPVAGGAGAPPTIAPITPGPSGYPAPGHGPVAMPAMPPDPRGVFYPLRPPTDTSSSDLTDVNADRRRREAEAAAAAAAVSASLLAAQQQEDDRRRRGGPSDQPAPGVKVKVQSDRDRNITLRRMTDEDARKGSSNNRRRRGDSVSSSHSESEPSSGRRYRRSDRRESRSSSQRGRAERAAEARVDPSANPLYPAPLNTGGSGTPRQQASHGGSSGVPPYAGPSGGQMPNVAGTISSLDSPGQWSALSPSGASQNPGGGGGGGVKREVSSAAERRQRRRFERREGSRQRAATESSLGDGLSATAPTSLQTCECINASQNTLLYLAGSDFNFDSNRKGSRKRRGRRSVTVMLSDFDQTQQQPEAMPSSSSAQRQGSQQPQPQSQSQPQETNGHNQQTSSSGLSQSLNQEQQQQPQPPPPANQTQTQTQNSQQQPAEPSSSFEPSQQQPQPAEEQQQEEEEITPGPRATRLQQLFSTTLRHTLDKISRDNFAACYPTIAARAPGTLEFVQRQMVERLGVQCDKEFNSILQTRQVVPKLNELETLVGEANKRKREAGGDDATPPVPPHTLPPSIILSAHLAPHLTTTHSSLTTTLQQTQAENHQLFQEIQAQRAEIEELLAVVEKALKDIEGANELLEGVVEKGLVEETRGVDGEISSIGVEGR
ncbi:hypothetical protein NEUTE1DRAFT_122534 [Neurospora tetrasperma FGSC 2508]|uniref:Cytochrome b561 domain-containing protein n=1 Tax=Neurospora tetrasperma (strain FGSC 2508 / ATCC MYA-4615 / P0657) TaxID=510951 RepID=F8MKN6_NEUT8|nr:uncharacterized protein NEUTE1DRAFT_122534 [Neurospora tetrasperma FGSC 2508]EGO58264.1 hypothetical protein NEUTE1DRAFT_122534 [Neurospora tetrasperma FGSC 2508]